MKSYHGTGWTPCFIICTILICLIVTTQASNECAPSQWPVGDYQRRDLTSSGSTPTASSSTNPSSSGSSSAAHPTGTGSNVISPLITTGDITAGEVNCRYTGSTAKLSINYYTCTLLANKYGITVEKNFTLNPSLHLDCGNIKADTEYCVSGFIEPVRAVAGRCGPSFNNATCLGTDFQCCNSKTFTCNYVTLTLDYSEDCSPGVCFEGACAGDTIYTTTGQCGKQHGNRACAGPWGSCCNAAGKCGNGTAFCGYGACQQGDCIIPVSTAISSTKSSTAIKTSSTTTTSSSIPTPTKAP
ncbi:hypothetical protein BKA61DRAFT_499618, partial [Leptodontidium sp. MPI-SDFR-AT-0119]